MKNFNNTKKKNKFQPIVLKVATSEFTERSKDIMDVCDEEYKYLFKDQDGNLADEIQSRLNFADWFANNLPIFGNKDTQFNSITCSYNKVNIQFTGYFSIGWSAYLDRETQERKYTFFYTIESNTVKDKVYNELISRGWTEV